MHLMFRPTLSLAHCQNGNLLQCVFALLFSFIKIYAEHARVCVGTEKSALYQKYSFTLKNVHFYLKITDAYTPYCNQIKLNQHALLLSRNSFRISELKIVCALLMHLLLLLLL